MEERNKEKRGGGGPGGDLLYIACLPQSRSLPLSSPILVRDIFLHVVRFLH